MQKFKRIFNQKFLTILFTLSFVFFLSGLVYGEDSLLIASYILFFLEWLFVLIEILKSKFNQRNLVILMLVLTPPIGVIFYLFRRPSL